MANVTKAVAPKTAREFIGRAWLNTVAKEGPTKGTQFMNIQLDNTLSAVTLTPSDRLQLWPNQKREGKRDADYRLSIVSDAAPEAAA